MTCTFIEIFKLIYRSMFWRKILNATTRRIRYPEISSTSNKIMTQSRNRNLIKVKKKKKKQRERETERETHTHTEK